MPPQKQINKWIDTQLSTQHMRFHDLTPSHWVTAEEKQDLWSLFYELEGVRHEGFISFNRNQRLQKLKKEFNNKKNNLKRNANNRIIREHEGIHALMT